MNNYMKTIISGLKQWVSSQKSDWNQNDSSAANFIKNRPFYSEEKEKVLFSGNVETVGDSGFYGTTLSYVPYEIGREYKVIFAGTAYICKAFNNVNVWSGHAVLLGNLGMLNAATGLEAEDTGEPFFFMSPPEEMTNIYTQTAGAYDVSISGTVEEVHQIDKKFVPMPDLADVAHTGDYYDLQNTPYIPWDIVRYGTTQSLTEGNKKIARNNIGAAAATDVSSLSTQIEDATDECITGLSVSGKVITYTKGDNSTGTITTQDTTYSNATTSNAGLMSTTDKTKVDKIATNLVNGSASGSLRSINSSVESSSYSLGQNAFAVGLNTKAFGHSSHAEGESTLAAGNNSHAEGYNTTASGYNSHTEGASTKASGVNSHAEGQQTTAFGNNSHAEGYGTVASGHYSHAEGYVHSYLSLTLTGEAGVTTYQVSDFTLSTGYVDRAIIYNGVVAKIISIDIDNSTITVDKTLSNSALSGVSVQMTSSGSFGSYSHAEGYGTRASGQGSHAEGYSTIASGDYSHAEGDFTIAASAYQHVQGKNNIEDSANKYAHIVGNGKYQSTRSNAHTLDWNGVGWFKGGLKVGGTSQDDAAAVEVALKSEATTTEAGLMSAADKTKLNEMTAIKNLKDGSATGSLRSSTSKYSLGSHAIALGYNAEASGPYSVALGEQTKATKNNSYAEGFNSIASGLISHAEGGSTTASGDNSHAEGSGTTASGRYSHAEGKYTIASGEGSHAEGISSSQPSDTITSSSTKDEIIESWKNISFGMAKGESSHSEGRNTLALSDNSHAEGSSTIAYGNSSHAEGVNTIASGMYSHAEGYTTIAASDYQHVQGKYNIEDSANKYAHIVGNGSSDTNRSNAHTLDWDGNAWFAGNIYVGGTGQNDATAVKVAIVPFPTAADEGKILRVVNGAPTWVTLSSAEEASF